ncbi:hypothetical protein [Adhaeretor mobilis]|uniref:Uncharacterized protein n=1 Tax=Adhaeretor mobilis TaxID=1930276 RepID=A0A517N0F1_9BACT|nr:hypothetical protein [Adhaeretor mobilis]QDT00619.1 hypothetical protein HG15A2_39580 [Adhaeretor mobilis]
MNLTTSVTRLALTVLSTGAFTLAALPLCISAELSADKPVGVKKPGISANAILARSAETYRVAETYVDNGISITTIQRANGAKLQLVFEFHTAFERAKAFRFAFRKNAFNLGFEAPYVVWHEGKQTMTNTGQKRGFVPVKSIGTAIAMLTGVSSGTSHNIPSLLMPGEIGGKRILSLAKMSPIKKKVLNNRDCYVLEGISGTRQTTLWIDKESQLILRIDEAYTLDGEFRNKTTSYDPAINRDVPNVSFAKKLPNEWKHTKNTNRPDNPENLTDENTGRVAPAVPAD